MNRTWEQHLNYIGMKLVELGYWTSKEAIQFENDNQVMSDETQIIADYRNAIARSECLKAGVDYIKTTNLI